MKTHVKIVGPHPWTGLTGRLVEAPPPESTAVAREGQT